MSTINLYRHYNLPIIHPYIAFFGDNWTISKNAHPTQHFHNCIELGYCKTGNGILSVEDHTFPFRAGDYIFIPENMAHRSLSTTEQSSWEYIYFDPYLALQDILPPHVLGQQLAKLPNYFGVITESEVPELHIIMESIFTELHNKEMYYQDSLKGLLSALIILLVKSEQLYHFAKSEFQWLYSAIGYIRKNYNQDLSISQIAQDCCTMSESHFRKKFRETMHISPLEYINHLRIRIACQAIYKNEKPINQIAHDAGFSCLSSFNRNFHALLNCSPSEWRKNIQKSSDIIEINTLSEEIVQQVFML